MATIVAPERSSGPAFEEALELLNRIVTHERVTGTVPRDAVETIAERYGVAIEDLQASAVAFDRSETRVMRQAAIERAAYQMGQVDGAAAVDGLIEANGTLSQGAVLGTLDAVAATSVGRSANADVAAAYARGVAHTLTTDYVRLHAPGDLRRQDAMRAALVESGTLIEAYDNFRVAQQITGDRERHFDKYAAATVTQAQATAALAQVTERTLMEKVMAIAAQNPKLPASMVLQQARMQLRTESSGLDMDSQRALQHAAWAPISMQAVERAVAAVRPQWSTVPPSLAQTAARARRS